jgi:hypothetical protein
VRLLPLTGKVEPSLDSGTKLPISGEVSGRGIVLAVPKSPKRNKKLEKVIAVIFICFSTIRFEL